MRKRLTGVLLGVFCVPIILWAQREELAFKQFHSQEGLSQSAVIAINQDPFGMLWLGTRDGLNRYDGRDFQVFRHDPSDSVTLSNNDILDIEIDAKGNLWVGTYNGLNYYDQGNQNFIRWFTDQDEALSSTIIRSIEMADDQTLWLGTQEGLYSFHTTTQKLKLHPLTKLKDIEFISDVYLYKQSRLWVASDLGLFYSDQLDTEKITFQRVDIKVLEAGVQVVKQDAEGRLWVGTREAGLIQLNENLQVSQHLHEHSSPALVNNNVRTIESSEDGALWIGTYNGLNRIYDGQVQTALADPLNPNSISENKVKKIFASKDGSIWVGTYYGGLNMWHDVNFNFNTINQRSEGGGLSSNVVSSILQHEGVFYYGTEGGGLCISDPKKERMIIKSAASGKVPSDNIKFMAWKEVGKQIWVCTYDAGMAIYDIEKDEMGIRLNESTGLSHNSVYDVRLLPNGQWCIGTFGGGINFYNPKDQSIRIYHANHSDPKGLSDDQVRSLWVDQEGQLWVGTQNGLNCVTFDTAFSFSNCKKYFYDPQSGNGQDVLFIYQTGGGDIWTATKEQGLYRLEQGKFVFKNIFKEIKGASQIIHSIEEDDQGYLWVSSNNGIARYQPESEELKLFTKSDGLVSNEYNNKASCRTESGQLYFGSPSGVTWFNPTQLKENPYTTQVILNELTVNSDLVLPNDSTEILEQSLATTEQIELNYDQANFSISYSLPSFVNSAKNSFSYRMKGLEEDWRSTSANVASYTIQNPGSYVFQIRGANSDGKWSENLTEMTIKVSPAPWRSGWAFAIYGSSIGLALFIFLRVTRSREQLKYELNLEQQLHKKEQDLIQSKLQFFTNISHEFRTPLTLILGPLEKIMMDFKGSSAIYKQMKTMHQHAGQLLKLINQLMDFRKIENNQAKLEAAEGNLVKFVREVYLSFKPFAKNEGYHYDFRSEMEGLQVYFDRDKLERVLYNLLSNAFKYTTPGGEILVEVKQEGGEAVIHVKDSGVGISNDQQTLIFDRFYQISGEDMPNETQKGTGIGLALTKSIVDLHHGQIKVESEKGEGSRFTVTLPLGKAHLKEEEIISDFSDSEALENYEQELFLSSHSKKEKHLIRPELDGAKVVLVVEDNPDVRQLIIASLMNEYQILEAENGRQGLEVAIDKMPDLIISDVMMPEMDGIEFCSQIKSNLKTSHTPFILLTARTSLIFKYEGLESGADEYINKPFNIKELQLKVRNMIRFVDNLRDKFKSNEIVAPSEVTLSSIDEDLMQKAIEIVDQNIDNQFFDVSLFCSELGVSRTMLFTKVKAWTNMTPNEFIHSMRMKRAANLLEQAKINVSQVSFKVGYKNAKYFSKNFQKFHGCTPTQYAQKFKLEPQG
ncbi:hybrid sensor histidine kinase/response regulator transcription factor [Reichenbachiella ulvae]|uniref:histidine kinase n=1 Tax=Reichenbachiella ulvae TaxID=2980104 RepID=A0ABT3CUC3_9BACT|nr:hybrid sensor histidine kinase/response regulator transcription factor [Reichenbachiella ulvae]MCV9387305.1 ATP-binding protein [Reichenbachiella ulvae]